VTEPTDWQASAADLERMAREDAGLREELARAGSLAEGYHRGCAPSRPQRRPARQGARSSWLARVSRVGARAADAAWLVLQHAIGDPDLQRRRLLLLKDAARRPTPRGPRWRCWRTDPRLEAGPSAMVPSSLG
jgi:hypothetical protein